jgi:hypothetical protein
MRIIRVFTPSPALGVSVVALLVALGGTSYAALDLPRNSVGTKQIVNGAVTAKKIRNRAVTAPKIDTSGLTVPNALHSRNADAAVTAMTATSASHASTADSATTAATANHASTADSATTATTATNAEALGGSQPSAFELAANIKTAVVMNNGTTATVVRGNDRAVADRSGAGLVNIFFPENVSDCTWIATAVSVSTVFANVEAGSGNEVTVQTWNTSGALVDANFHLLIVC